MNGAAEKLAILLWAATPERPELCAAPFVYAATAAALDCEVEIHFSGPSVRLLVEGVAAGLGASQRRPAIADFMGQAANLGVRFLACAMALKAHLREGERLIPECAGTPGAGAFVERTLDCEWRTLVF